MEQEHYADDIDYMDRIEQVDSLAGYDIVQTVSYELHMDLKPDGTQGGRVRCWDLDEQRVVSEMSYLTFDDADEAHTMAIRAHWNALPAEQKSQILKR